jgi:hypothetical protein
VTRTLPFILVASLLPAASALASDVPPHRFALVIAENEPSGSALQALRYADDDGLRYAEFLRSTGAQVELLTVLDAETQRRYPGAAQGTRPGTRAELVAAMTRLNAAIDRARSAGQSVDFYFVFAGHGEAGASGEGRMHLRDTTLSRAELLQLVVAASHADFNHLLIDACHAQALVFNRGPEQDDYRPDDYRTAIASYLDQQDLRAYPNTGAILASTAGRETHEWEVFGAGVFSHEVRSGLTGVADANGDGAVEYSELAAYVHAANDAIPDESARPMVVFQPPSSDRNRPLLAYTDGPRSFLRIPRGFMGRAWLEDARGNRYADFNSSGEAPIVLALADAPFYYLRRDNDEARVEPPRPGVIDEGRLSWRHRESGTRGALSDAFQRHLYGQAYGSGFYAGFVASSGLVPAIQHNTPALPETVGSDASVGASPGGGTRFGVWPYATGGLALALGGVAAWQGLAAIQDNKRFDERVASKGIGDKALADQIEREQALSWTFGAAGIAAAGAAVTLFLLDRPDSGDVAIAPAPGGFVIGGRY